MEQETIRLRQVRTCAEDADIEPQEGEAGMNLMKIKIFRPDNFTTLADEVYNNVKLYYFLDGAKMLKIGYIDEAEDTIDIFISLDRIGQITVENIESDQ